MNNPTEISASNGDGQGAISKMTGYAPVDASKRIAAMDMIRGFALIGILLMNIEWFNRPVVDLANFGLGLSGIDWGTSWLVKVFVEGKFWKLFTLLFGMGFAIMLIKAKEAGRPFGAWFTRRMGFLFLMGIAHLGFLWGGDILHVYAIGGMILLAWVLLVDTKLLQRFNNPRSFLRFGLTLAVLPFVVGLLFALYLGVSTNHDKMNEKWQLGKDVAQLHDKLLAEQDLRLTTSALLAQQVEANEAAEEAAEDVDEDSLSPEALIEYKAQEKLVDTTNQKNRVTKETDAFAIGSSFWQATVYRFNFTLQQLKFAPLGALIFGFPILLMGYWLVASGVMREPEKNIKLFKGLAWIGVGFGLVINVIGVMLILHPALKTVDELTVAAFALFTIGQYVFTGGYFGLMMVLILNPKINRFLQWLAPLGRMALTNYIAHSVILTSIFYGYGGGMFGEISRSAQMLMVLAIIIVQVIGCRWWLNHYQFGPLEWLWRSLTYLKVQPMKIVVSK